MTSKDQFLQLSEQQEPHRRQTRLIAFCLLVPTLFTLYISNHIAFMQMLCAIIALAAMFYNREPHGNDNACWMPAKIFMALLILVGIRGLFISRVFVDFRYMFTAFLPSCIACCAVFFADNTTVIQQMFRSFWFITLPCAALIFPFFGMGGYSDFPHVIMPVFIILLTFPYIGKKTQAAVLLLGIMAIFYDTSVRTTMAQAGIALIALLGAQLISLPVLRKWIVTIFLGIPIVFFFLGVAEIFDFNQISEELDTEIIYEDTWDIESNFLSDSRSSLWTDVGDALANGGDIIWGLSPGRSYYTSLMKNSDEYGSDTGRRSCEVSILTLAGWGGILLCIAYFMMFCTASWHAVAKGKNRLAVALGFYIALRWGFSFLEDPPGFYYNFFWAMFAVGMCLNDSFIQMDEEQMRNFWQTAAPASTEAGNHISIEEV